MSEQISTCPIWGGKFEAKGFHSTQTNTIRVEDSPRAGGGYEIDEALVSAPIKGSADEVLVPAQIKGLSEQEKVLLTTWLVDQRLHGDQQPHVTEDVIGLAKNKRLLQVHERAEKLLRFLATSTETIADHVDLSRGSHESLLALAWSESTSRSDLIPFQTNEAA